MKPGVVPLRPLGVGELLDGAITSMRENPRTMLGLSAIVAVLSQLLQVGVMWVMYQDLSRVDELSVQPGFEEVASLLAGTVSAALLTAAVTFLATTILTGILTVVVSRAVLGERIDASTAWREAGPQVIRLIGLTLLVGLAVVLPFAVLTLPGVLVAIAADSRSAGIGLGLLGLLVAIPVSMWIYVKLALSTPVLMLETTNPGSGAVRRPGIVAAMRRSGRLVSGAWWRTFGILLLVILITSLVQQVISIPTTMVAMFFGGLGLDGTAPTTGGLLITALGGFIGLTITMPFTAAVTVLLYVDRRIRREGLDIELARAAGVTIPGRTDVPPATGGPAQQHWT